MAKCHGCGTGGSFGNAVWKCPMCDKELCNECMESNTNQSRGGFLGIGESFKCPKCGGNMKKVAW